MADITMRQDKACPHYEECYLAQAPVNPHWQSYRDFHRDGDRCMYYAPMQYTDGASALRSDDDC